MMVSSLPAHNVGRKTLISHGSTDRCQATWKIAEEAKSLDLGEMREAAPQQRQVEVTDNGNVVPPGL